MNSLCRKPLRCAVRTALCLLCACTLALSPLEIGYAESSSTRAAKFASNEGNLIFLGLGMGLNLLEDGPDGTQHSLRATDAVLTSSLVAEILKKTVREQRPDGSGHSSFPSGHATAAFAAAAIQSEYHPWQSPLWFAGASLIAASRVKLHRHYVHDVVAGGLLGAGTAELEMASCKGLLLIPVIDPVDNSVALEALFSW
jgi:hypothetical protein